MEVSKPDPHIASGSAGEPYAPDLPEVLRKIEADVIRIPFTAISPGHLRRVRIDVECSFPADFMPLLKSCRFVFHHVFLHFLVLSRCALSKRDSDARGASHKV